MDTSNYAVTEYTSYPFNSFCEFEKDTYYGADATGIYEIGGPTNQFTNDEGTAIDLEIKKEKIDLGVFNEKRVAELFFNLESSANLTLTLYADNGSKAYTLTNGHAGLHTLWFVPGKGLKGKFIDFKLQNLAGSDFKLNEIELLIDILSRRASEG